MFKNVWKPSPILCCLIDNKLNDKEPLTEEDVRAKKQASGQRGPQERSIRLSEKTEDWGKKRRRKGRTEEKRI